MLDVEVTPHFWITLKSGKRLAARLWRPLCDAPVPVILEYLPYRKRDGTAPRDATTHALFARHGYACLRVDIQGSGESDGLFDDEYSENELSQGEELIAWAAAQPWSNGKVGIIGISWGGFNGLQLAYRQPPALAAVVSVCSTVDRYADDIHFMGGCLLTDNFNWSAQMTAYMSRPPDPALREDWQELWRERLEAMPFFAADWLNHPVRDAFWQHGSVCEDFSRLKAPVLAIGGWADAYLNAPAAIAAHGGGRHAALLGPWEHKYPHIARINPADFHGEVLNWFDAHLKGGEDHLPAMRAFIQTFDPPSPDYGPRSGRWIAEAQWPSPNIAMQRMFLAGGRLCGTAGKGKLEVTSPCHTGLASAYFCAGMRIGHELSGDQAIDDELSVCFDSEVLHGPLELLGRAELEIAFQSDQPRAHLIARLGDVAPDGRVQRITYRAFNLAAGPRQETAELLTPGRRYVRKLVLNMCGYRLKAGHKLRLSLSTHYWPVIWPAPVPPRLMLDLAACQLNLPVRQAADEIEPQAPPPPRDFPLLEASVIREPSSRTERSIDEAGRHVLATFDDFGSQRIEEHGLQAGSQVVQRFAIRADDPLSAIHEADWQFTFARGDWSVRIETMNRMTASETDFHLDRRVVAYLDGREWFRKSWSRTVERGHL